MSVLRLKNRRLWSAVGAIAVLTVLWLMVALRLDRPVRYDAIDEHFKYGSIGSEPGVSLLQPVGGVLPPYLVFTALPSICSDKLPRRLRVARVHHRARPRPADRRVAAAAASASIRSG